ncbi:Bug family tripartite tricarboxylate transporter substrate binding protein [Noviherbaspirillum saxi]|uniref:Tripartite tricarboxylate transporter substrate binding protein n=1 Tax=Noviherbaspirillum saxi TaxID=2320863 RepID=A0A3A3FKS2_9BURK|nr:tripartite tricarboxylate transporter substrate binding protein [Noviherbaspirillum saxi]RJF95794.1 tripartite tricarboxylate transporter substrate binding protein [Noviherbaspirillum saxi]
MISSAGRRALLVTILATASGLASATERTYLKIVVPFSAGGITDQTARMLADKMASQLGQAIIIENRPGGGSRIGIEAVAKAAPDGMTLLFTNISYSILPVIEPNVPFDPMTGLTPVTTAAVYGLGIVTNNNVPAKSLPEFIQYARKHPGKLNYGSAGPGSGAHFAGEFFKSLSGTDLVHVPYRSTSQALADVAAGVLELAFDASVKPYVDAGKVKLLAVTGSERDPRFPNVPTAVESGLPNFVQVSWLGFLAPPATSPSVVERIGKAANLALRDVALRTRMQSMGLTPQSSTPEQFSQQIRSDIATYRKIAAESKLKFE